MGKREVRKELRVSSPPPKSPYKFSDLNHQYRISNIQFGPKLLAITTSSGSELHMLITCFVKKYFLLSVPLHPLLINLTG